MTPKYFFITLNVYSSIYLLMFVLVEYSPEKLALLFALSFTFIKAYSTPNKTVLFLNAGFAFATALVTPSPLLQILGLLTGIFSFWCGIKESSFNASQTNPVENLVSQRLNVFFQSHLYFLARILVSMVGFSVFVTTMATVFMDKLLLPEYIVPYTFYAGLYLYGVIKLWSKKQTLSQTVLALFFVFDMLFSILPSQMSFATTMDSTIACCTYLTFAYLLLMRANQFFLTPAHASSH